MVGRPRDDSVDVKVVDAVLEILNTDGLGGLSIEGIASRAGVSKATIYRRWDCKEDLLVDAIATLVHEVEVPDSGDIRSDLTTAIAGMTRFVTDTRAGEVFPWLVGEIANRSEIGLRYASSVIGPRRSMIADLIAHAVDRGDLRANLDIDLAVDMLTGPVVIRRMLGRLAETPNAWAENLVNQLLEGWER
ncbi:MAG TPA: TetR/AcrR family transcriptional regulator [Acidimicrobiia bacterium]